MKPLELYNSLSGKKECFKPIDPDHVRLYACGPTVYSYAHIGNARMAVVFDLLSRLLQSLYPRVTYVSNITDVDDKIINASKENGDPIDVITKKYGAIYNEDMGYLGVDRPDIQPLATEHIGEMIEMIATLIGKGHAYEAEGHVLFDVPSFPPYGSLSKRSMDDMVAGARVEVAPYKRDAADFILWKPSNDSEPGWDSPWGRGRPGWHIECSAMAEKHLGLPFDIHGGGADLKFPHHENEIAQSCCANDEMNPASFAKYWVHNGFVTVDGEKMAKSIGNITLVHNLMDSFRGETLRMTLLSGHYRQPLDWSESTIQQADANLSRLYTVLYDAKDVDIGELGGIGPDGLVLEALCDDLNTPRAFAALNALSRELSAASGAEEKASLKAQLLESGKLIGILQQDPEEWLGYKLSEEHEGVDIAEIERLIAERQQARVDRNFKRADEIRDMLADKKIILEDSSEGVKWRITT